MRLADDEPDNWTAKRQPPQHWHELEGPWIESADDWALFLATANEEELLQALDIVRSMTLAEKAKRGM